jgi:hypothetical protein
MGQPATDATYIFGLPLANQDGVREEDGVMIIDDSATFLPNASVSRDVVCVAEVFVYSFQLISTGKY